MGTRHRRVVYNFVKSSNMVEIIEFLEKSTIHGLSFIKDAKSLGEKAFWAIIVTLGFGFAACLIASSYSEWIDSPVSTVVTTKPISDLEFPEVTICPPRGSNTVLNLVMKRVKADYLNWWVRWPLVEKIKPIYTDQPKSFAQHMSQVMNIRNFSDLKTGKILIPEKNENLVHFQVNTSTMENLRIQAKEGRRWKYSWQERKLKLYKKRGKMPFAEAEAFCVSLGGHLASVQSVEENGEVLKTAEQQREWAWLGGSY